MPTTRIDEERWRRMEKKAVNTVIASKETVKESDVIKALIDNYLGKLKAEEIIKAKHKSNERN